MFYDNFTTHTSQSYNYIPSNRFKQWTYMSQLSVFSTMRHVCTCSNRSTTLKRQHVNIQYLCTKLVTYYNTSTVVNNKIINCLINFVLFYSIKYAYNSMCGEQKYMIVSLENKNTLST